VTASDGGVAELLDSLHFELDKARVRWEKLQRTKAPRFRSFAFFSKREVAVSKMVAALLDPSETHGQGRLFLDHFLDKISNHKLNHLRQKEVRSIKVEDRTTQQRRIDIVVYFSDGFQFGIENKVFGAKEQPNQISHYADALENRVPGRYALLFLHPEGAHCTSLSEAKQKEMEEQNRLIQEPAKPFLSSWIKECVGHCEAKTVKVFLLSLQKYIEDPLEETFMDSTDTRTRVIDDILKSSHTVEAALAIEEHIRSAKDAVLNNLLNKIHERLEARLKKPDMDSCEWTVSRSTTVYPAKDNKPIITPNPARFQVDYHGNEWRYVGIENKSPTAISVELELGFKDRGSLDSFGATIGIHKTGQHEWHEIKEEWIPRNSLDPNQETQLDEAMRGFGDSYTVINHVSITEDDWHWSRNLNLTAPGLNNEATETLFRTWNEAADPFFEQLIEMLVNLAKVTRRAVVSGKI
jgi:hypothetical protein